MLPMVCSTKIEGCTLNNLYTGELGLGFDEPKSATKPTRNIPLVGLEVFEYVPG